MKKHYTDAFGQGLQFTDAYAIHKQTRDCQLHQCLVAYGDLRLCDQQSKTPSRKKSVAGIARMTLATDDNFGHTTDLSYQKDRMSESDYVYRTVDVERKLKHH